MIHRLKGTMTSGVFILLALLILSFLVLAPVVNMIILGAIFAYGLRPISRKIEPFLKFRSLSIVVAMVILIIPLIIIIAVCINALINTTPELLKIIQRINTANITNATIQQYIPVEYHPYATSFLKATNIQIADVLESVINYLLGVVKSIPMIALEIFVFLTSTFYFARDGNKIWEYIEYSIPDERRSFFDRLFREIRRVLKSIFFGHFLTALIIGLMAAVGFSVLGYSYSLFLGILTGFLQLIPVIGPWPTYTALAIYDFLVGNIIRGVVVLFFGFFLSGIDIYLRPKLSGKYADIHPLIFLLGFLCGPIVFGIVGFVLGPLILGVTHAAVVAYRKEIGEK